ncbi:TPA: hypothetical protein ACGI7I_003430 [Clostridioides difficile]
MIKFEIGKTYATRSVCDHDCMFTIEVIKRTDKTIAFIEMNSTKYKTEYIRNFDQYVDEFSTLEEAEECLQECLSA